MTRVAAVLTSLGLALSACGNAPASHTTAAAGLHPASLEPGSVLVVLSDAARAVLSAMSTATAETRVEHGACITRYVAERRESAPELRILLLEVVPAEPLHADSVSFLWRGALCGDSLPSVHSHVLDNGYRDTPSGVDFQTAVQRPKVPFHLLVIGGTDSLVVYGWRPWLVRTVAR